MSTRQPPRTLTVLDHATNGRITRIIRKGLTDGQGVREIADLLGDEGFVVSREMVRRFVVANDLRAEDTEPAA